MQELIQNLTFNTSMDNTPTYNFMGHLRPKTSDEQLQTSLRQLQRSMVSTISNPSIVQLDSGSLTDDAHRVKKEKTINVDDLTRSQVGRMKKLATVLADQHGGATDFALKALQQENKDLKSKLEALQARHEAADKDFSAQTEGVRSQIAQLRQQNDENSQQLLDAQQERLRLQLALKQAERETQTARAERDDARLKCQKQHEQVEAYAKQIQALQDQLSSAENAIQMLVRILEQHKILPPPIANSKKPSNSFGQQSSFKSTEMTGSVVKSMSAGRKTADADGNLSATVVHTSPTMIRKCSACNTIDNPSPSSSTDNQNSNDRAAKVLTQLRQEKKDTEQDLQNLVAEAYVNPEALYKNINQVSKLINQNKAKKREIKQLSMYKKQVDRLGVKMK